MWRLGDIEEGHSKNITISEYRDWITDLHKKGYVLVRSEEGGNFQTWGRETEVELDD
jgi:hypothetical protein